MYMCSIQQLLYHTTSFLSNLFSQKVQEEWYESLNDWEAALHLHQTKQYMRPDDIKIALGRMRCLHALGEW